MKEVSIYVKPGCPYCDAVERLFTSKKIPFEVHNYFELSGEALKWLNKKTKNWPTAPMVFIGGKFYGGFDDIRELEDGGELDIIIKK